MLIIHYCFFHKVLCILPYEWLRWCSIIVALCLSGSVLVMTFWPAVRDDHPKVTLAILSAIAVLNVLLAVGCKVNVLVIVIVLLLHNFLIRIKYKFKIYGNKPVIENKIQLLSCSGKQLY